MTVITRFAPSPTGYLHIGGARTALFNWLFARHHGGKFLLRIEDTDRARSTQEAVSALLKGLKWLGLDWDGDVQHQFSFQARHAEVANQLIAEGKAYFCYATTEELDAMRKAAEREGKPFKYDRRWRDRDPAEAPEGIAPAIRLKAPTSGSITVRDQVRGEVTVDASELDDMVLLRADGTPTYMLAVVVDDHEMGITHVIRGDDHFTNTFRQTMLYQAMGWDVPEFAHIPLIHGEDGAKLSKRHGAIGIEQYEAMGYLPEAMRNYLLRLGWSHGDDEIISTKQAIEWFNLESIGKSPARLDFNKLNSVNAHYMKGAEPERLVELLVAGGWWRVEGETGAGVNTTSPLHSSPPTIHHPPSTETHTRLTRAIPLFTPRANTLVELAEQMAFLLAPRPVPINDKAQALLDADAKALLKAALPSLSQLAAWDVDSLKAWGAGLLEEKQLKMKQLMPILRAAVTGRDASPGVYEIMAILGRGECIGRIQDVVEN